MTDDKYSQFARGPRDDERHAAHRDRSPEPSPGIPNTHEFRRVPANDNALGWHFVGDDALWADRHVRCCVTNAARTHPWLRGHVADAAQDVWLRMLCVRRDRALTVDEREQFRRVLPHVLRGFLVDETRRWQRRGGVMVPLEDDHLVDVPPTFIAVHHRRRVLEWLEEIIRVHPSDPLRAVACAWRNEIDAWRPLPDESSLIELLPVFHRSRISRARSRLIRALGALIKE